jgi:predicted nucleic acid-binding protein
MIVADTGATVALIDADDRHHGVLRDLFERDPASWVLPWATLPEVDYLIARYLGARVEETFVADVASERFVVEWGSIDDLSRAHALVSRYRTLHLGLVDAVVLATAERLRADAIATLDLRHFGVVKIAGRPKLLPRDL